MFETLIWFPDMDLSSQQLLIILNRTMNAAKSFKTLKGHYSVTVSDLGGFEGALTTETQYYADWGRQIWKYLYGSFGR